MKQSRAYQQGYDVNEDAKNPYTEGTQEHADWQKGFDESMNANAQNIDPSKLIALGYGHLLPDSQTKAGT